MGKLRPGNTSCSPSYARFYYCLECERFVGYNDLKKTNAKTDPEDNSEFKDEPQISSASSKYRCPAGHKWVTSSNELRAVVKVIKDTVAFPLHHENLCYNSALAFGKLGEFGVVIKAGTLLNAGYHTVHTGIGIDNHGMAWGVFTHVGKEMKYPNRVYGEDDWEFDNTRCNLRGMFSVSLEDICVNFTDFISAAAVTEVSANLERMLASGVSNSDAVRSREIRLDKDAESGVPAFVCMNTLVKSLKENQLDGLVSKVLVANGVLGDYVQKCMSEIADLSNPEWFFGPGTVSKSHNVSSRANATPATMDDIFTPAMQIISAECPGMEDLAWALRLMKLAEGCVKRHYPDTHTWFMGPRSIGMTKKNSKEAHVTITLLDGYKVRLHEAGVCKDYDSNLRVDLIESLTHVAKLLDMSISPDNRIVHCPLDMHMNVGVGNFGNRRGHVDSIRSLVDLVGKGDIDILILNEVTDQAKHYLEDICPLDSMCLSPEEFPGTTRRQGIVVADKFHINSWRIVENIGNTNGISCLAAEICTSSDGSNYSFVVAAYHLTTGYFPSHKTGGGSHQCRYRAVKRLMETFPVGLGDSNIFSDEPDDFTSRDIDYNRVSKISEGSGSGGEEVYLAFGATKPLDYNILGGYKGTDHGVVTFTYSAEALNMVEGRHPLASTMNPVQRGVEDVGSVMASPRDHHITTDSALTKEIAALKLQLTAANSSIAKWKHVAQSESSLGEAFPRIQALEAENKVLRDEVEYWKSTINASVHAKRRVNIHRCEIIAKARAKEDLYAAPEIVPWGGWVEEKKVVDNYLRYFKKHRQVLIDEASGRDNRACLYFYLPYHARVLDMKKSMWQIKKGLTKWNGRSVVGIDPGCLDVRKHAENHYFSKHSEVLLNCAFADLVEHAFDRYGDRSVNILSPNAENIVTRNNRGEAFIIVVIKGVAVRYLDSDSLRWGLTSVKLSRDNCAMNIDIVAENLAEICNSRPISTNCNTGCSYGNA